MSTQPLIPNTIEPLMQLATMVMLNLDPTLAPSAKIVRVGWQQTGQPAHKITEDVCYVRCVEDDDEYNRIRDEELSDILPEPSEQINVNTSYTRVWRTFWTFYGPNSFDNARKVRSGLFKQDIHDLLLQAYNTYGQLPSGVTGYGGNIVRLYLVTDVSAPTRVPELFEMQWWERVDFSAQFNEGVVESDIINAVASTEIIVENAQAVLVDEVLYTGNPPPLPVPHGELESVTLTPTADPLVYSLPYAPALVIIAKGGLVQDYSEDFTVSGRFVTFAVDPTGSVLVAYARS